MGNQFTQPTTEATYPNNYQQRVLNNNSKRPIPSIPIAINSVKNNNSEDFDSRCYAIRNGFVRVQGNQVIRQDGLCCQVLISKSASKNFIYSITVIKSQWGNIGWGIIDNQYRDHEYTVPYDPITPNIIYFDGWSGAVYGQGDGVLKKQSVGFAEGAKVLMEVCWDNDDQMEIKWQINRDLTVIHRTRRFCKKRISWVPFIKLWTIGDIVRFQEELK